jgi:hypothetical protein
MALTRVTGTVIENNAISADKLGNASITGPMIATGAISADKLSANVATDGPSSGQIARVNTNLTANVNSVKANVDAAEANVAAIKDATTDLDIGNARYFFDKSAASLGIANGNPVATSLTMGSPGNVIINYGSGAGNGNVIIGTPDPTTAFRLDVRGTANTGAITATSVTLSADAGLLVPNDGNIGSAGATDAMQISSGGIVTFKDDILIKNDGTIGSAGAATAMTIDSSGIVTFVDDIKIKDGGTIGSASAATAMTIASDGIVTFVDDIKIKDSGTIGSASAPTAMTIASDGVVTFGDDIKIKDDGTFGTATTPTAFTIAADGDTAISGGLGVAGNTGPVAGELSLGTPANVIIRATAAHSGNVVIGNPTGTASHNLDVRGTANVGALTSTSHTSAGAIQGTTLTATADGGVQVPNDGNIGSAGATDAMQISSAGIVTFKDDIKIKDGGTIGSATDPAAITIAAAGGVTFSDRSTHSGGITIADGGQIGSVTTAAAVTIAADGLVTIGEDLSVTGNLTVLGDTTTVNTNSLVIQDNFMALANSQPFDSATTLDSGIFFNRGSAGNAALYYDQSATGFRLSETRDPFANATISPTHDANLTLSNLFAQTIQVPNDGKIGSAGSTSAMTISSGGIVTFADDIKIKDGGTIGSATTPAAITVASDGIVTFADDIKIKNDGTIGSAGAATAMSIDSSGIVTFIDDIKIKDGGTIGSATTPAAITVASDGIVTFADDIKIKDGGTIGSASAATAMTIDASGIVTFVDDIKIKDGGTIGVASAADAMTISSAGIVTFKDDILVKDGGTIGSATTADAITVADIGAVTLADDLSVTGNATVTLGLGATGNTAPATDTASFGNPANVVIRAVSQKGGNVIIGDATATSDKSLDVRGTANTGALTATTVTISGLTASRALQTDGSKGLESSAVTTTELGRLSGVTGDIQTQLDAKIATTDSASNDFITFTRLNANVNAVMANVDEKSGTANTNAAALASGIAAITGGGTLLKAHTNSNVQAAGSTANTFFIGAAMPGDGLANILSVSLDGVVQQKDVPSGTFAANNDFIINAAAAHASIKFTAPSIPVGSTVVITALKA